MNRLWRRRRSCLRLPEPEFDSRGRLYAAVFAARRRVDGRVCKPKAPMTFTVAPCSGRSSVDSDLSRLVCV
jgi:hypothetical protein